MAVHVGGRGPGHMARASRRVSISTVAAMLSGVPSILLDPSDLTSMFTASTGVTQVASDGDTVGLILDVAQMAGVAAGTFITAQPELAVNGGFGADTDWTKGANWTIATGTANAAAASSDLSQAILTVGSWYKITYTVSNYVGGTLTPKAGSGMSGPAVSANGTYSTILRATTTTSLIFTAAAATLSIDNVSVKAIPGNHAFQATAGSRPLYKTSGGVHSLLFDGTDDGLATASVDMTSTQKITFCAGVRVLSDAAQGYVAIHGIPGTNPLATALAIPRTGVIKQAEYSIRDGTNTPFTRGPTIAAPVSRILSATGDYTGSTLATQTTLRSNGSTSGNSTGGVVATSAGFGNYAFYIGNRADGLVPLNGYIYGLAVGGKLCDASEINMIERWLNQQMGGGFL